MSCTLCSRFQLNPSFLYHHAPLSHCIQFTQYHWGYIFLSPYPHCLLCYPLYLSIFLWSRERHHHPLIQNKNKKKQPSPLFDITNTCLHLTPSTISQFPRAFKLSNILNSTDFESLRFSFVLYIQQTATGLYHLPFPILPHLVKHSFTPIPLFSILTCTYTCSFYHFTLFYNFIYVKPKLQFAFLLVYLFLFFS